MLLNRETGDAGKPLTANYAFKPIAEQALRPNQTFVPRRLNAALGLSSDLSCITVYPSELDLQNAIEKAAAAAVSELFSQRQEHFYYLSLITTGQASSPNLCAWSSESLVEEAARLRAPQAILKWSYADSPYYCYGEVHFSEVRRLFSLRPALDPFNEIQWMGESELRVRAMENAMRNLDRRGFFGSGQKRLGIVMNVEVMPPDYTNTERALRLNPKEALLDWLKEAAE